MPDAPSSVRVYLVLDRSGSMSKVRKATVDAFNVQLKTLQEAELAPVTTLSLITFANDVRVVAWDKPVSAFNPLTVSKYNPDGGTALYDAVGKVLERSMPAAAADDSANLVIIISDGEENSSRKFTSPMISERVTRLQNGGRWTFSYIGADGLDLAEISRKTGIYASNMMNYPRDEIGTQVMGAHLSRSTEIFMASNVGGLAANTGFTNTTHVTEDEASLVASPAA